MLLAVILALSALACAGLQAQEVDPAVARLRDFYAVLLQTMKDADRLKLQGRYDKLAPALRTTFDLPAMTRIAVGPQWTTLSDSQRQQLVQEFSRMTIASYAANFARYAGETFEVDPSAVPRQSNRVLKSRLLIPQHDAVIFNYLFHSTPDGWKAIDIYLSGTISELATRRSEFSSILSAEGPEALISHLKSRADKLMQTG